MMRTSRNKSKRHTKRVRRPAIIVLACALSVTATLAGLEALARILGERPNPWDTFEEEVWVGDWRTSIERRPSRDQLTVTELTCNQRKCGPPGCVTINRHGFRRAPDAPPLDSPGATTIVMVGDSFTFGYGVNDQQTVPALLEHRFHDAGQTDIRVLNLGMNGMNAVQASRLVATRAISFNPATIVYLYHLNDAELYWQEGNPTLAASRPLFTTAPFYQRVLVRSRLFELAWLRQAHRERARAHELGRHEHYYALLHRLSSPGLWAARMSIEAMKRTADSTGANLLVVLLPNEMTAEMAERTTGQIATICRTQEIPVVDLLGAYLSRPDRALLWTVHGPAHLDVGGNRLVAGEIYQYLTTMAQSKGRIIARIPSEGGEGNGASQH